MQVPENMSGPVGLRVITEHEVKFIPFKQVLQYPGAQIDAGDKLVGNVLALFLAVQVLLIPAIEWMPAYFPVNILYQWLGI